MISLIICTYKRAISLNTLLNNILTLPDIPFEILIIDGSPDGETKEMLDIANFNLPIKYWQVDTEDRGLTKQRNFGIKKADAGSDIICFLDDDVILDNNYFSQTEKTFKEFNDCIGLMGIITNENRWEANDPIKHIGKHWFVFDGFSLKLSKRQYIRNLLGLFPNIQPGLIPGFGHGYDAMPPSGKIYQVEHIIGASSFRKYLFDKVHHSEYFEGYGLYEDYDFSVRAAKFGKLLVDTNIKFEHHHHPSGRPDTYKYGKMVTRNGWYVWRLNNRHPLKSDKIKWYIISLLLAILLLDSPKKRSVWMEFFGRIAGIIGVIFVPPKIDY